MTTARNLVDAIQSGKSATIQATFDALMTEKIQDGIEAYRQAVIDTTFNPELVSESEEISESFYVYHHDGKTNAVKKKFATNAAAKKHAEKLGGDHKVASSEYWHDKLNPSKNESELDEVAYDSKALDDKKKPVIARGVKGMKSTPFEKKFKSMSHYEKWADSEASGNHEVHDVRLHESDEDESSMDSSIDEEFDLSEYTLEEIQEFMESEDFASLDELSKKTLASYIKKSSLGNLAQKDKEQAHTKDMLAHMSNGARKDAAASAKTVASISKGIVKRQTGINKATDKLAKE